MHSVIKRNVIIQKVAILSLVILSVVMLSVIMLIVMAQLTNGIRFRQSESNVIKLFAAVSYEFCNKLKRFSLGSFSSLV